eukprot:evm.model.scf_97.9 EVM.evm.TU.scf_97.9   scf_97:127207-127621(+)
MAQVPRHVLTAHLLEEDEREPEAEPERARETFLVECAPEQEETQVRPQPDLNWAFVWSEAKSYAKFILPIVLLNAVLVGTEDLECRVQWFGGKDTEEDKDSLHEFKAK